MPCTQVKLANGAFAIVCTGRRKQARCADCGSPAGLLCDYPVGKGKTCDRNICGRHAQEIGPDLHYCEAHWRMSGIDPTWREGEGVR